MSAKLLELAERKAVLTARAASQRAELAQALQPWRKTLAVVDQGVSVARYVKRHPALLVGAVVFIAVLRPRRAFIWLRRGWVVWRMALSLKRKLSG